MCVRALVEVGDRLVGTCLRSSRSGLFDLLIYCLMLWVIFVFFLFVLVVDFFS